MLPLLFQDVVAWVFHMFSLFHKAENLFSMYCCPLFHKKWMFLVEMSLLCQQAMKSLPLLSFLLTTLSIRNRRLTLCSSHVTYSFQSESTLPSCLNVKENLARNRHKIWSLSVCNGTRTHNHLVCKRTFNHLAKLASLAKCLSIRLRTKWLYVPVQLHSLKRIEVVFHKWSLLYLKI